MKKYIDETKKIEELERLLATTAIMKAISTIEEILEKHKHNVETSPEYI